MKVSLLGGEHRQFLLAGVETPHRRKIRAFCDKERSVRKRASNSSNSESSFTFENTWELLEAFEKGFNMIKVLLIDDEPYFLEENR